MPLPTTYYSNCTSLTAGCTLYTNAGHTTTVPAGKYSDSFICFTVNSLGVITSYQSCASFTTTTTVNPE